MSTRPPRRPCTLLSLAAAAAAAAASATTACSTDPTRGYAFTSPYRTDIDTVAVPIFENATYAYGLEVLLTDALAKEIHRVTPWRIADPTAADTTLTGSITNASLRTLSTGSDTGLANEMAYELTVAFEWKSNTTGRVLAARRNLRAAELFVPARPAGERIEIGQDAAVNDAAKQIVAALRDAW